MKKQHQKYLDASGDPVGDCFRTAIACLLNVDRDSVPHFVDDHIKNETSIEEFWAEVVGFVEGCDTVIDDITIVVTDVYFPVYRWPGGPKYVIANGKSPRGDWNHCVIVDAVSGDLVWDPHPQGTGLDSVDEIYALTLKGEN